MLTDVNDEQLRFAFIRNVEQLIVNPNNSTFYDTTQCHQYNETKSEREMHGHSIGDCMELAFGFDDLAYELMCRYCILKHNIPDYFFNNKIFNATKVSQVFSCIDDVTIDLISIKAEMFFTKIRSLESLCFQICKQKKLDLAILPTMLKTRYNMFE